MYNIIKFLSGRGHKNYLLSGIEVDENERKWLSQIKRGERSFFKKFLFLNRFLLSSSLKADFIFVYDPADAMALSLFSRIIKKKMGAKLIYYNLELFVLDYENLFKKLVGGLLEQILILNSDFFVALSPKRLELAKSVFKIRCPTFIIPNSYDFEAEKLNYFPSEPPRVLLAGGLEESVLAGIESGLDGNFIFVFHGLSKYGIENLKKRFAQLKNVEFYERFLSYDDFKSFVSKHDIGFVWYDKSKLNDRFAGWSASKYFRYLSIGKPVIVRDLPELKETTEENNFGVAISSFSEIKNAVSKIVKNYSDYVKSIEQNYSKFEFTQNFKTFYEQIT
jgi:glycosyltransferase involved in cell wall biosynthesis